MKTRIKDGWHTLYGWEVYVEEGRIMRGVKSDRNGSSVCAYPYRKSTNNSWTIEDGISYWAFVSGVRRGTVCMF